MIKNIFGFNQKKVLNLIINTNKIKLSYAQNVIKKYII